MDALQRFNNTYRLLVGTGAAVISPYLLEFLRARLQSESWAVVVLLVVIALGVTMLNEVVAALIDRSAAVRRLITGADHIEGFWHDLSIDQSTGKVVHGVVFGIRLDGGVHRVSGVTFDASGRHLATFRSARAAYSDHVLHYEYESHTEYTAAPVERGIGQLQFESPPQSYSGFYFDLTSTLSFRVHGRRVTDDELARHHRFRTIADKRDFVVAEIAKHLARTQPSSRLVDSSERLDELAAGPPGASDAQS